MRRPTATERARELGMLDEYVRARVVSSEIPERLIESLALVPLVGEGDVEAEARRIGGIARPASWLRREQKVPTGRQLRALRLYANGLRTTQIARSMGLSEHTVREQLWKVRKALGAHHTGHAIAIAFRRGLLT